MNKLQNLGKAPKLNRLVQLFQLLVSTKNGANAYNVYELLKKTDFKIHPNMAFHLAESYYENEMYQQVLDLKQSLPETNELLSFWELTLKSAIKLDNLQTVNSIFEAYCDHEESKKNVSMINLMFSYFSKSKETAHCVNLF